jgi:SET domain-containing protein
MRCNPFSNGAEADYARPAMPSKYTPGDFDLVVRRASAGLGLFAESPIPKGACVIEYWGRPLTPEEETTSRSKYLFALSERRTIDGAPRENLARYINHSCRPNCEPIIRNRRVFIFAKRNIRPGEELSYDYGKEYFDSHIKPLGCRCAKCAPERHA